MSITIFYKNKPLTISFSWIDPIWQKEDVYDAAGLYVRLLDMGFIEEDAEQWCRAFTFKKMYRGLIFSHKAEERLDELKKILQFASR
jgi:hypothetical protein